MNSWKTILSFVYPHEAHLARTMLESEGFQVIIKDELTAQVNNFYSNAIGGVKLLVRESDSEKAIVFLKEGGFIDEPDLSEDNLRQSLDHLTSGIPILGSVILELRLIILAALILFVVITLFVLFNKP